jgi:hypothetical protein
MRDTQLIELKGRHRLVEELLRADLEVALPVRDRGVDLIAYAELSTNAQRFSARPIQMKATSGTFFMIDRKYEKFPDLLIAFVWHVLDPARMATYVLTYKESVRVANAMGYTRTDSWLGRTKTALRQKRGAYSTTRPGRKLKQLLEPYKMSPEKWRSRVIGNLGSLS